MFWRWGKKRNRQRLAQEPFSQEWLQIVRRNCRHFSGLTIEEQARFLRDIKWFVAEKNIQTALGLTLTDEMRVTIAAHVALIGLGFDQPPFDRLISVIIRPETYVMKSTRTIGAGMNIITNEARIGEAWKHGPVVLSWQDIQQQCRDEPDGRNVILHEFAHLLDMANGEIDGIPPMENQQQFKNWLEVTQSEYQQLVHDTERGHETLIDGYGATSPVEFFAVATETFFEMPSEMQQIHPRLYSGFCSFYRQNPARRQTPF